MMMHIHVIHVTRNFYKALANTSVDEEPFEMKAPFSSES